MQEKREKRFCREIAHRTEVRNRSYHFPNRNSRASRPMCFFLGATRSTAKPASKGNGPSRAGQTQETRGVVISRICPPNRGSEPDLPFSLLRLVPRLVRCECSRWHCFRPSLRLPCSLFSEAYYTTKKKKKLSYLRCLFLTSILACSEICTSRELA